MISTRKHFSEYVVLKFVSTLYFLETSAEVCTNFSRSLYKLQP